MHETRLLQFHLPKSICQQIHFCLIEYRPEMLNLCFQLDDLKFFIAFEDDEDPWQDAYKEDASAFCYPTGRHLYVFLKNQAFLNIICMSIDTVTDWNVFTHEAFINRFDHSVILINSISYSRVTRRNLKITADMGEILMIVILDKMTHLYLRPNILQIVQYVTTGAMSAIL